MGKSLCNATGGSAFSSSSAGTWRCCRYVENSRLRLGGMAVGPVRPMPTHVCRRQNGCRCARRHPNSAPLVPAMTENMALMRLLACIVAAVVYVRQEQREYLFPQFPFSRCHSRRRYFSAARAASNHRKPWSASCVLSAGTLWKSMPSSSPAPSSLSSWCPISLPDRVEQSWSSSQSAAPAGHEAAFAGFCK